MSKPIRTGRLNTHQQGFALFIVMIVMMVTAVLVVAAAQTYNTELRISANDADRKATVAAAEAELHIGEAKVAKLLNSGNKIAFTSDCAQNLCSPAGSVETDYPDLNLTVSAADNTPAWERACGKKNCLDPKKSTAKNKDFTSKHIIEFISYENNRAIFRITARAVGRNANTTVTLQSYVEALDE